MNGVGAPSGSLKDFGFDRSIALQRSCRRYLLMASQESQKQEASLKEYLITGSRVKKDKQGTRSLQARCLCVASTKRLEPTVYFQWYAA